MKQRKSSPPPPPRFSGRALVAWAAVALTGTLGAAWLLLAWQQSSNSVEAATSSLRLEEIPFNGARAYEYLKDLCALGPRPSGSPGMAAQQRLLEEHFRKLGGKVEFQRFRSIDPRDRQPVEMANIIVRWHPESRVRILLGTHYDTRPYPDRDTKRPRGRFIGGNDGASGVAILMELAHEIPQLQLAYGVDFVLFDAEEFVFSERDRYFLGSEHFARQYIRHPPPHRYRWAVVLDMVGDKDLQIFQERNSLSWPDSKPLVADIWATAARLRVREFIARPKHEILDDHIMLHEIAKIPACLVIDFDYPHWHTEADVPDQCSPLSLAKVGWVIREWLTNVK